MKILYISTVFPKPEINSTIYTDLVEELSNKGHEIIVVATDNKENINKTQIKKERGIIVLRVKTGNIYNVNYIRKGISIITLKYFLISAIKKYLKNKKFDLILFESPPITIVDVVNWAMNYFKCPSYLMLKDIFPQNAVDIGIIKRNSLIYKYFKYKEKKLYKISTLIGCMSQGNKDYILEHNPWINKNKVEIFPNTKKIKNICLRENKFEMRKKYGIPLDVIICLYGGNMGKPQGLEFILEIMNECSNRKDIFFLLVGRGTERYKIYNFIEKNKIKNAMLIDYLSRDEYEMLMNECDIGLIFLDKRFSIPNFPSRILSYFEYSLPILAATDKNTDFKDLIIKSNSGFWVEAGNKDEFINKLDILIKNKELRDLLGHNGRKYLEKNFHVGISSELLENHYKK